MLNKWQFYFAVSLIGLPTILQAQDDSRLSTLFTTSQERILIDSNRYKNKPQDKIAEPQQNSSPEVEATTQAVKEPVTKSFNVSGFTLTISGQNVAWINGKPYENGSLLEDGSKLYISNKKGVAVQIKTPDGKYHSLPTGKPVEISYQNPIDKG